MKISLKIDPTDTPITCDGANSKCETCRIGPNGSGYCPGCNGHCGFKGDSNMWKCHRECMTCGGGEAAPNTVPAICCKSPLAEVLLPRVDRDNYNWVQRPIIDLEQRGIVVTQGSPGRIQNPYPPETQLLAVNLRHVWSSNGWFSRDMKDYLRVPRTTKLLLLTMTHDDVLERAWDLELHEEEWGAVGFDYWQPLTFSTYHTDSKMNMYYQWRRTLHATERSAAWFSTGTPWLMTSKAREVTKQATASIPQIIFNAQFNTSDDEVQSYLRWVLKEHNLHPKTVPFWFVGVSAKRLVRIFKSFLRGRPLYFLSTAPWLSGHKGSEYTAEGKMKRSVLPKDELIVQNQRTYMDMVASA